MSDAAVPDRLDDALPTILCALQHDLRWLRAAWGGSDDAAVVDQLVAAAGTTPSLPADAQADVDRSLERMRTDATSALARIANGAALDMAAQLTVAATWWGERDPHVAMLFGCAHDDGARRHLSGGLAQRLLSWLGLDLPATIQPWNALARFGLLLPTERPSDPLCLTGTARELLDGRLTAPVITLVDLPPRCDDLRAAIAAMLGRLPGGVVVVRGPDPGLAAAVAAGAVLDLGRVPVGADRSDAELSLLSAAGLAVPVIGGERAEQLSWPHDFGLAVVHGEPAWLPPCGVAGVFDVPPADTIARTSRWRSRLDRVGADVSDDSIAVLAGRFRFGEGDIDAIVARADAEQHPDIPLRADDVWRVARVHPRHDLDRLASLVAPEFRLEDLVLETQAHEQLDELVAHVALQHVVLDGWGFRSRMPRGQGVVALFTGPPGTGKTMATEAVALALGQDLWRVDLSCVVSKYIGETEKNLSAAFDAAERAGAVLFFDEADALFAKRTDVRNAHDRYANLEVNYLLQRVESFTGLVVLASNRQAALDDAFLRRLRFVIRFEAPGVEQRAELWRRAFPPGSSVEGLDWSALATADLSGGNIQTVALHAAFAAATAGEPIGREHVDAAMAREYAKLGRSWSGLVGASR